MKKLKTRITGIRGRVEKARLFVPSTILLAILIVLSLVWVPAGMAQSNSPVVWLVQSWHADRTGLSNPVGITFSSRANAFEVLEGQGASAPGGLVRITPAIDRAGVIPLTAAVQDPINMAYDAAFGRLLLIPGASGQLMEIREDANGNMDPTTLARHDMRNWGVQIPQGITVDQNGVLFILDATGPKIVRVQPGAGGDLDSAAVSEIALSLPSPRGIAYDPTSGNLHVLTPADQKLYELTQSGEVVGVRDLAQFDLRNPQGMVFAPSGDQTDDPAQTSLFLADAATTESAGQVMELSLVTPESLPSGTVKLSTSLVRTFKTSSWSNPSPDPSGIDYWPAKGQFILSDPEIEEPVSGNPPAYWKGYNVFFSTLSGSLAGNCTTFKSGSTSLVYNNFSREPTGVAINEKNNHVFYSDDDLHRVFEVGPGPDGQYCTSDDTVVAVSTANFGAGDTEDVTLGNNTVFLAGGTDGEVYQFSMGANGVLGGGDDGAMTHFDTAALGFHDLEGVEYNPATGTLFIISTQGSENYMGEVSTSGKLLRAYDLSFMGTTSNMRSAVVYAPASQNQSEKNIYIASRAVDNNTNRLENDGKVWEINISSSPTPTPTVGPSPTSTPVTDPIFSDSFESGNLSAWSTSATDSGDLSVTAAAAMAGTSRGLQAVIDDNNSIYVNDDTPNAEAHYRARFYFDPNSISMIGGDSNYIFQGYAGTSTSVVRCPFRFYNGAYQVRCSLINDSGTWLNPSWQNISDAPHVIEFDWLAATAAGANNGSLTLWIDGVQKATVSGVDNDTRRVDRARLGATGGIDSGTRGTMYFDAFVSRRQTYIGP